VLHALAAGKTRKLAIYPCKSDNPHVYWVFPVRFLSDMRFLSDFKSDKTGNCRWLRQKECLVFFARQANQKPAQSCRKSAQTIKKLAQNDRKSAQKCAES